MEAGTAGKFRFVYAPGEAIEGDFFVIGADVGIDEGEPKNGCRTYKCNGQQYYTLVSDYIGQPRLTAGHVGYLKAEIRDIHIESEVVVTSTSIRRTPDENEEGGEGLFEEDGSLKLIQKFTVTM